MKRPNITPGPWYLGKRAGAKRAIYGDKGAEVALPFDFFMEDEEALANARAIAAVPALLEALENALPGLESDLLYCERHPQLDGLNQEACLAHKRARIDKARSALTSAGYQF